MKNLKLFSLLILIVPLLTSCGAEIKVGDTWLKDQRYRGNPFKPDRFDEVTIVEVKEDWVRVESSDHRYTQDRQIIYFRREYSIKEVEEATNTETKEVDTVKEEEEYETM